MLDCDGVCMLTCKFYREVQDKPTLFPPRISNIHIFDPKQSDQLVHCMKIMRITRPMKEMNLSTTYEMVQFYSGFPVVDKINVTTYGNFIKTFGVIYKHEDETIVEHDYMTLLLNEKYQKRKYLQSLLKYLYKIQVIDILQKPCNRELKVKLM